MGTNYQDIMLYLSERNISENILACYPVSYTHLDVYKRQAQGKAEGVRLPARGGDARAGARTQDPEARGGERLPKKIDSPEGGEALPNREKAAAVSGLSGQYPLSDLLECAGLAR